VDIIARLASRAGYRQRLGIAGLALNRAVHDIRRERLAAGAWIIPAAASTAAAAAITIAVTVVDVIIIIIIFIVAVNVIIITGGASAIVPAAAAIIVVAALVVAAAARGALALTIPVGVISRDEVVSQVKAVCLHNYSSSRK
jgi:hypothetical protein